VKTALVLAGGGARGAYEAGALSVLLPELERRGERPTVYVGTSVGALNAALLASTRHLPAVEAVDWMLEVWRTLEKGKVIRPILSRGGPAALARYTGELLSIPGVRMKGVLDPDPLWRNVDQWIDWEQIHRNVDDGLVEALAVVATSARTGRSVVFAEEASATHFHRSHAIAYVSTRVRREHVLASAAIPLMFPPVEVTEPERARGWYVDGGTRLNAPIKPALDLGAERLVVVACDSIAGPVMEPGEGEEGPPDFGDGMLHLLEGALVDPLIEDMRTLGSVNLFYAETADDGPKLYRSVRGKAPYRKVPYVFVGTEERGAVGHLAARVFREHHRGLRALRSPDFQLLTRLVGGESPTHGELLSLLFFDRVFTRELIAMGGDDARRWLDEPHDMDDGPWQLGPLTTFTMPRQWTAG
jgi:NTE family protein